MKQIQILIFSRLLQIFVRVFARLTQRGGGKFAQWLPKEQQFLVNNYCGNLNFYVNTTYPIEASIWLAGIYDVTTTRFLQSILREDDVFLDVGANCGAITLVAAQTVTKGQVYAFEPGPVIRSRLEKNLAANPQLQSRVKVVPFGLGSQSCRRFYYEDPNYRGNGALFATDSDSGIEVISLDEWLAQEQPGKIDVIKIDVEGMEYEVLKGSRHTLEQYQPIIYFETLPIFFTQTDYNIGTLYKFLKSFGYIIVSPQKPHKEIPLSGPYPANSVAIPPNKRDRLPQQRL